MGDDGGVDLGPTGGAVWSRPEEWAARRTPEGCVICRSGGPLDVVAELAHAWATAPREAPLPGYLCVVAKRHVNEPFELPLAEQAGFWLDAMAVAQGLHVAVQPTKLNYEVHGNTLPHLHLHLFPRTPDDPFVGGPIDPRRASCTRSDEELAVLTAAARATHRVLPTGRGAAPARQPIDAFLDPGMAAAWGAHASDGDYNAHYDRPAVLDALGDVYGLRVLDAACGAGLYAAELVGRGATVVGFDGSEAMLALARRRLGPEVALHLARFGERLPFEDGAFDRVVCALAIHHAPDRRAAFGELHRVLRPGGRAVVSTSHPAVDWIRKGGSYFDTVLEADVWRLGGRGEWQAPFWREPLSALTDAATSAGFLIERLIEPQPDDVLRVRSPATFDKLSREPDFLVLSLRKL